MLSAARDFGAGGVVEDRGVVFAVVPDVGTEVAVEAALAGVFSKSPDAKDCCWRDLASEAACLVAFF